MVNKMFVFLVHNMPDDSSQKRFNPVWLDFVLICQHWIRQSINVPAQSCNHVKEERNMACDNDLAHLLQRWQPGASICLRFVRRMLMPSVYCAVMARRNVGCRQTKERLYDYDLGRMCSVNRRIVTAKTTPLRSGSDDFCLPF